MRAIRVFSALTALSAAVTALPAAATGVARVVQADGSVQHYRDVRIDYSKAAGTLTMTTADGKGKLIIEQAACSYIGDVYRCLLQRVTLSQHGKSDPLAFETGTIYANTSPADVKLPMSSQTIPVRGVVMTLRTKAGTYISLTGTIDSGLSK